MRRLIGALAGLALVAVARPQGESAQTSITLRVGVVIVESQRTAPPDPTYATNYAPHVFYNLDANRRMMPAKFTLDNPAHPPTLSAEAFDRWTAIAGATGVGVGSRLGKRHAAYWEVFLESAPDSAIANFDLLLLPAHGYLALNSIERERLRRFMDRGGILWVDLLASGSSLDQLNGLPVPFDLNGISGAGSFSADFFHPLLSYPNELSTTDLLIAQVGGGLGLMPIDLNALGIGALAESQQWVVPEYNRFVPVASDEYGPILSVARVGDGFQVVSTRGLSTALNRVPGDANLGFTAASSRYDRAADAAAKLFVNLINLASSSPQTNGGSQRSSGSPLDVRAPLLESFRDEQEDMTPAGYTARLKPAISHGVMAITMGGTNHVHVYDANPERDLDGDGDTDDGLRDLSLGFTRDEVWSSRYFENSLSAPVIFDVPEESGEMTTQVAVVDSKGTLWVWPLLQYDPDGSVKEVSDAYPYWSLAPPTGDADFDPTLPEGGPYAPTFHDGLLYMADSQGAGNPVSRIWVVDPVTRDYVRSGTAPGNPWYVGGTGFIGLGDLSASPTIGHIAISDNSGGLDKVLYLPTRPNQLFAGPNSTAGVTSFWLAARGEKPLAVTDSGGFLTVATRASNQGLRVYLPQGGVESERLGIKLTVLKDNGDAMTAAELSTYFTGDVSENNGILTFTRTGNPLPAGAEGSIRLDYHIDWGTNNLVVGQQIMRGNLYFPDDADKARRVVGSVALSARGTMQIVTSTQSPSGNAAGGSFWTVREEGRGTFRVLNRWDLYNEHTIVLSQSSPVTYREALVNSDPLTTLVPILSGTLGSLTFVGGPAVKGDIAYVVAQAVKPGIIPIPSLILLAFDAEPEVREIRINDLEPGFSIIQPDMLRSSNKTAPEIFSTLQGLQYTYERDPGSNAGTIRVDSLSATSRGPIVNSLSTSQPVIIRRAGSPDLLVEPGSTGSRWSPLLWYSVLPGFSGSSSPLATGDSVYVAGESALPTYLKTNNFTPANGLLAAIDSQISPNDRFVGSDPDRPWQKQAYQVLGTSINDAEFNPAYQWPQIRGSQSLEDIRIRFLQSTLGDSTNSLGVAGGEGLVVSWADGGIFGFRRADITVADEGRVSRFDSVGNSVWSLSHTTGSSEIDAGGASNSKPLVRPTRAYTLNERESIVVDTGGNRVIRLDSSGRELRSVSSFKVDPSFRPDGYVAGESTRLKSPRDVAFYVSRVADADNPFSPSMPYEFWRHYVIADGGNHRIVEVVDRYVLDPVTGRVGELVTNVDGEPALGLLLRHSPSNLSGSRYEYNSLSRIPYFDDNDLPRYVLVAGVGNLMSTRAGAGLDAGASGDEVAGTGNGAIIVFDGSTADYRFEPESVVSSVTMPAFTTELWDGAAWVVASAPIREKRLSGLNSVSVRTVAGGSGLALAVMFTDSTGAYEVVENNGAWDVRWMLPRVINATVGADTRTFRVYSAMRRNGTDPSLENPRDFVPAYARRLTSGDVIIANAYVGSYPRVLTTDPWPPFSGEVIQVIGDVTGVQDYGFGWNKRNFGFESLSIRFKLPPIQGARGLVAPTFADRR